MTPPTIESMIVNGEPAYYAAPWYQWTATTADWSKYGMRAARRGIDTFVVYLNVKERV